MNQILKVLLIIIAIVFLVVILYLIYNILQLKNNQGVTEVINNTAEGLGKVIGASTFKVSDKIVNNADSKTKDPEPVNEEEESVDSSLSSSNSDSSNVNENGKCPKGKTKGKLKIEKKPSRKNKKKNLSCDNYRIVLQTEEEDSDISGDSDSNNNQDTGNSEANQPPNNNTATEETVKCDNLNKKLDDINRKLDNIKAEDDNNNNNNNIINNNNINSEVDKNQILISKSACGIQGVSCEAEGIYDNVNIQNNLNDYSNSENIGNDELNQNCPISEYSNDEDSISSYNSRYNENIDGPRQSQPPKKNEVYNIDQNIFTYDEAPLVCKAFGGKLATPQQLISAHKKGANWCNYGWSQNQMGLFPIQKKFYDALQEGPEKYRNDCGKPGINGGYFEDKNLKLGVNCYGPKPDIDPSKVVEVIENDQNSDDFNYRHNKELLDKYNKIKERVSKNEIDVLPFNHRKWSTCSDKKSKYIYKENIPISETPSNKLLPPDPKYIYDYNTDDDYSNDDVIDNNLARDVDDIGDAVDGIGNTDLVVDAPYDTDAINEASLIDDTDYDIPPDDYLPDIDTALPSASNQSRICREVI